MLVVHLVLEGERVRVHLDNQKRISASEGFKITREDAFLSIGAPSDEEIEAVFGALGALTEGGESFKKALGWLIEQSFECGRMFEKKNTHGLWLSAGPKVKGVLGISNVPLRVSRDIEKRLRDMGMEVFLRPGKYLEVSKPNNLNTDQFLFELKAVAGMFGLPERDNVPNVPLA
ncbi:MAG: hypothetical protein Q8Q06_03290 [bacterium]|nr:hypothetical protein [bacterium]